MLTLLRVPSNDEGNALIPVILVSLLVGVLSALTLATGEQADWASAKDRNHEIALGVTEAGIHDAIARVEERLASDFIDDGDLGTDTSPIPGSTEEGAYRYFVDREGDNLVIDAEGTVGQGMRQQRKRHVKVTLSPPELFPEAGYALFSKTSLYLKNNNEVYKGDIWANDSLWVEANARIGLPSEPASLTSAQSWIRLEQGAEVSGYVWAGGRKCEADDGASPPKCINGWGINQTSGTIGKWAKSSVSAPNCLGENANAYKVILGGHVVEDVTSLGPITVGGSVGPPGQPRPGQCTTGQPRKDPPLFTFKKWNYPISTYREFGSAAEFNSALNSNSGMVKSALEGTFVIQECEPDTPANRVVISGAQLAGNVTVVTNPLPCENGAKGARIYADGVGDDSLDPGERAKFVLVSHYAPVVSQNPEDPEGFCTDKNDDFCAISAKNHFDPDCKVAVLVYADNGPVSMKNDTGNEEMCGSVIANGIHMKNGLQLTYDPLFDRVLGFGPRVYEIARWEELPVS